MPHVPDHADHDPELIAAYAAGDATGSELDAAAALVAGCPACAELHHDLRLIAAALPTLPAAHRTRDFRLSAGQAAALRSPGWRRLLSALAGPRFGFAAPLGTALATLGLAGLLISGPGLPFAAGGATSELAAPQAAGGAMSNVAPEGPSGNPSAAPSREDASARMLLASPAAAASDAPVPAGSPAPIAGVQPPAATAGPSPDLAAGGAGGVPDKGAATDGANDDGRSTATSRGPDASGGGIAAPPVAGAIVLLAGIALVVARWLARRLA
jgi:hypothetical protein